MMRLDFSVFSFPRLRDATVHTLFYVGAALLAITHAPAALAHKSVIGDIEIAHAHTVETVAGQTVGGVFFKAINNLGTQADQLISASIDKSIADHAELHVMNTENDIMRMRHIDTIHLPAGSSTPMTRGLKIQGYHIMLMGLKKPFVVGEKIPLKLRFERAGSVEVTVVVESLQASSKPVSSNNPVSSTQHLIPNSSANSSANSKPNSATNSATNPPTVSTPALPAVHAH